jgi:sugar O-acyltransferase (sialic acid O-acetyltransferase NeuD family)
MSSLLIIGAGGHGKVVADAAETSGRWKNIVFIDKRWPELKSCAHWPVVAQDAEDFPSDETLDFIVAIGDNRTRARVFDQCVALGLNPVSVIHPSATISKYAEIGLGCVVFAGAVINVGAKIGQCAIVNTGATIDHDCVIGCSVHVSPGAHLAGEVSVGDFSWIGIGASVKQCLTITNDVVVGAGACVVSDISDSGIYVGVPAVKKTNPSF